MMDDRVRGSTRSQEHEIRIDAPVDAVWRAISDAEEVTRWFVQSAEIEPRVGGTYKISWGEGMDGTSEITAFDPGERLRIEHVPVEGSPEMPTGPIAEEYQIRSEGGVTVLRLVSSGIPDTEEWDWFYDGTKRGWTIFFLTLRHYLEHHFGTPRDHVVSMVSVPDSAEDTWAALMGERGLGVPDAADLSVDEAYQGRTEFGQTLRGRVLLADPPYRLLVTVEDLDNALLGVTIEQMGPSMSLYLSLSTFGLPAEKVAELGERWPSMTADLFPSASDPADAYNDALGTGTGEAPGPEGAVAAEVTDE